MPRGKLWETELRDHTPVWLLEWDIARQAQRRVLLAVDTTDSCATENEQVKSFFRTLLNALDVGDSCAMWLVGVSQKVFDQKLDHSQRRAEMAQKMAGALHTVRSGTWFKPTVEGMVSEARLKATDAHIYFLLVSDGEIFDAEQLLQLMPRSFGLMHLGQRQSSQMSLLSQITEVVTNSDQSLQRFLRGLSLSAKLKHSGSNVRVVQFSAAGELTRELSINDSISLGDEETKVRVAFVGGSRPEPRLEYQALERTWDEIDIECARLVRSQMPHLEQVLRLLDGNEVKWDVERLELLAKDRNKTQKLRCPSCPREMLARKTLFCACKSLLVSLDGIKQPVVLRVYQGRICFPITDGVITAAPYPCDYSTGDHSYHLEDGESPCLVLDLYKS
jgi:hypothetical protein